MARLNKIKIGTIQNIVGRNFDVRPPIPLNIGGSTQYAILISPEDYRAYKRNLAGRKRTQKRNSNQGRLSI